MASGVFHEKQHLLASDLHHPKERGSTYHWEEEEELLLKIESRLQVEAIQPGVMEGGLAASPRVLQ